MSERQYWLTVEGKDYPDHEAMIARLLDEGILFCNSRKVLDINGKVEPETLVLFLNCNDCFVPASDAECITIEELPELFKLFEAKGDWAAVEFVAKKRNMQPRKKLQEIMRRKGVWNVDLESFAPNKF